DPTESTLEVGSGPTGERSASTPAAPTPALADGPAELAPAGPGSGASPGGAAAAPALTPTRVGWSARVAAGEFDAGLAEADERGVDAVLASASAQDLVALGDAARYRGRGGVASRCLTALRKRFAGSP